MNAFRIIEGDRPVRLVQVGAGGMGRAWLRTISNNQQVELVGLVDLDLKAARLALDEAGLSDVPVSASSAELIRSTDADAIVNVTVPEAHLPVNEEAMDAGAAVLCEKPAAPTVALSLIQAGIAEKTGQLLMISQSRRYSSALRALVGQIRTLGRIGTISTDFFKAPRFGGFREEMEHVLLVDMAIHQFDMARLLMDTPPVAVYCQEYNPDWSWFAGAANALAVVEFEGGGRYVFNGSWCSPGLETSWNGTWRISGEHGTAIWDGDGAPVVHRPGAGEHLVLAHPTIPEETAGALEAFVTALRTGEVPDNDARSNIHSLAMVEAAVASSKSGERILIEDVIGGGLSQARKQVRREDVRDWLENTAASDF